jgi:hypothetical protein
VTQLVEVPRYKPEGSGFASRWCFWNFSLTSFRPHFGSGVDSASNWNDYQVYFLVLKDLGASNSWKPQGISRPVMELFYNYTHKKYKLYKINYRTQSRFSEFPLFERHFRPFAVFEYVCGIETACSSWDYVCVHAILSGFTVLTFRWFICVSLCVVMQFKYYVYHTLTIKYVYTKYIISYVLNIYNP